MSILSHHLYYCFTSLLSLLSGVTIHYPYLRGHISDMSTSPVLEISPVRVISSIPVLAPVSKKSPALGIAPVAELQNLSLQDRRREPTHSLGTAPSPAATTASASNVISASRSNTEPVSSAQEEVGQGNLRVSFQEPPGRVPSASASSNTPTPESQLPATLQSLYRDPEIHRYILPSNPYAREVRVANGWRSPDQNNVSPYDAHSNIPEYDVHRERRNIQRTITPQSFSGMCQCLSCSASTTY